MASSTSYRTQGRRLALQVLYSGEFQELRGEVLAQAIEMASPQAPPETVGFAQELLQGIVAHTEWLDRCLAGVSTTWHPDRIHPVERNILRIGLYEMTFRPDIPGKIVINEAVDLAKRFGDDEAGRFINGVLAEFGKKRLELESDFAKEKPHKRGPASPFSTT